MERFDTMSQNYYEEYWEKTGWRADDMSLRKQEVILINRHFDKRGSILDYGCGSGLRYGPMMKGRGNPYIGADVSQAALKQANSRGLQTTLIGLDDGKTALESGSFDYAICMEVLEHVMNPTQSAKEIYRLLKPGGTLILSVPNAGVFYNRLEFLLTGFLNPGGNPETSRKKPWEDCHIRFYNVRTMKKLLSTNGFEVKDVSGEQFSPGDVPWVYKKPKIRALFNRLGFPLWWVGNIFPGIWSGTLYFVAQKAP